MSIWSVVFYGFIALFFVASLVIFINELRDKDYRAAWREGLPHWRRRDGT